MEISDSDILNFLKTNGMLDLTVIRESVIEMKEEKIFKNHGSKVWQGKDGYWRTYVETEDGRKLVKKSTKEKMVRFLLDGAKPSPPKEMPKPTDCFEEWFNKWVIRQQLCGRSGNTINKYKCDYRRFFKDSEFERTDIREITDVTICQHIEFVLATKEIPYRALAVMYGLINSVFQKAIRDRMVTENPCQYVDLPIYRTRCHEKARKDVYGRTFSDDEIEKLMTKIYTPPNRNPNYICNKAVELAIYTGMRVGEISALMWEDVDIEKGYIVIQHSERKNRETNEYFVADTKNHKVRVFPITDEIADVLEQTKKYEIKNGYYGQFVFQDKDGRLHTGKISSSVFNKTGKSIHALRRTLNSKLKCSGVSTTIASSLLGHTEQVNRDNYTYDISDVEMKRNLVNNAYHFG